MEQCVGLHSIILQRIKQASELQNHNWGHVIVGSIRVVKAGLDQSRLHKMIQSRQQSNSDQGFGQALIPLDNLYQACYELLSESFTLLSVFLERSKPLNTDVSVALAEICDEIVPLCQDNQLRFVVDSYLILKVFSFTQIICPECPSKMCVGALLFRSAPTLRFVILIVDGIVCMLWYLFFPRFPIARRIS